MRPRRPARPSPRERRSTRRDTSTSPESTGTDTRRPSVVITTATWRRFCPLNRLNWSPFVNTQADRLRFPRSLAGSVKSAPVVSAAAQGVSSSGLSRLACSTPKGHPPPMAAAPDQARAEGAVPGVPARHEFRCWPPANGRAAHPCVPVRHGSHGRVASLVIERPKPPWLVPPGRVRRSERCCDYEHPRPAGAAGQETVPRRHGPREQRAAGPWVRQETVPRRHAPRARPRSRPQPPGSRYAPVKPDVVDCQPP